MSNYIEWPQKSKMKQANKQKIHQKQDQKYSNETMARIFSTAEIYGIRSGYPTTPKYGLYVHFDSGFSIKI